MDNFNRDHANSAQVRPFSTPFTTESSNIDWLTCCVDRFQSGKRADQNCCNSLGDVTNNGSFSLEDPVYFLYWTFLDYPDIDCHDAADADDDGALNLADSVYMLMHLFLQGPAPLPPAIDCGFDPTDDGLLCEDSMLCP